MINGVGCLLINNRSCYDVLIATTRNGVNHLTVEVDSPTYSAVVQLCMMQMLRFRGPESKTAVKKQKLDPSKTYEAFYIGGKTIGHAAIIQYAMMHDLQDDLAARQYSYDQYRESIIDGTFAPPIGFNKRSRQIVDIVISSDWMLTDQQLIHQIAHLY